MTTPDHKTITEAARIIREGGLVAMPTETVYGLAADATNDAAVARIYEAKGRPSFNPLIIHVADQAIAECYVSFSPLAIRLAGAFWPGPLTLVLPRKDKAGVSLLASAGLPTLAVRMPAHPVARALLKEAGVPLAAPSANRSGSISPTTASHVEESLGRRIQMILDGGPSRVGLESTIVKIDGDNAMLLRAGGIPREDIESVIGKKLTALQSHPIEAPGMMSSHYAPRALLRLNAEAPRDDEAFLAFGKSLRYPHTLNLSEHGDLVEAAANLFAHLHALDALCAEKRLSGIAAASVPHEGLGEAINDLLARASAR